MVLDDEGCEVLHRHGDTVPSDVDSPAKIPAPTLERFGLYVLANQLRTLHSSRIHTVWRIKRV
jgi:hypothetical protein